jgi:hypothetical protein
MKVSFRRFENWDLDCHLTTDGVGIQEFASIIYYKHKIRDEDNGQPLLGTEYNRARALEKFLEDALGTLKKAVGLPHCSKK